MDIRPTRLSHFNQDLRDANDTLRDLSDARDASRFDDDASTHTRPRPTVSRRRQQEDRG